MAERRRWREWQPLRDVRQYVFLDECGVTTDLLRRYCRSPRGIRLRDHTPCGHWQTHTVVAALRRDGLRAPAVFDGPIDSPSFLAYVEQVLVREGAAIYFAGDAPLADQPPSFTPAPRASCPDDNALLRPVSVGALTNAYARARACFAKQMASGKSWREVK